MSELSIYQPSITTQACVRSFALASKAPKISNKEEVLILSRLMSAVLGYNSVFWSFLRDTNDGLLSECEMMARRCKRQAFLERAQISPDDHAVFFSDAKAMFTQLDEYADRFDQKRGTDSGLKGVITIGHAFITAQDVAQRKSMENGLPAIHYVNPYVAINVASTVLFDIFKGIEFAQANRTQHDLQLSIRPLYLYVEQIRKEYPVHLSPNIGVMAYKNDQVRNALMGTYTSLDDHIRDIPDVDIDTARAFHYGMICIRDYLSPFVCNTMPEKKGLNAAILTFSDWKPLVAAAKEKRALREQRRREHPEFHLPENDL